MLKESDLVGELAMLVVWKLTDGTWAGFAGTQICMPWTQCWGTYKEHPWCWQSIPRSSETGCGKASGCSKVQMLKALLSLEGFGCKCQDMQRHCAC